MARLRRYRTPGDLPARIPVFPLRGVILLPGAPLPLNVFEPRYLAMMDDTLAGNRIIGIIQPESSEEESPPGKQVPLRRIGCAGRITAYQEAEDGRLQIIVTGIIRFRVVQEVETAALYRLCDADYDPFAGDLRPDSGETVDRARFLSVLKSYLEARNLQADWKSIRSAPTEPLINSLSLASPFSPEEKQALLEAQDLKTRSEVLIALAEMELASDESGAGSRLQ